jgi:hypothetical protein
VAGSNRERFSPKREPDRQKGTRPPAKTKPKAKPEVARSRLYLDQELWNEARKAAIDEGMPVTRLVEQLLRKYQEARMKQRRGGYKRRTKKIHELEADTSRSRARPASSSRASRAWAEAFRRIASRKTKDALHRLRSQGPSHPRPRFRGSLLPPGGEPGSRDTLQSARGPPLVGSKFTGVGHLAEDHKSSRRRRAQRPRCAAKRCRFPAPAAWHRSCVYGHPSRHPTRRPTMKRMAAVVAAFVIAVAVTAQAAVPERGLPPDPACPLVDVTPFAR